MNAYFGYLRVSTTKQGEGVSLQEQRDAISRFAERNNVEIARWFEEKETAAKRGRPMFNDMLKLLRRRTADGVIIHKIDRSARNLKDWADLGELIDKGIEVHFANESLDLHTRGGRLSADIQAVVAADYVRNLREETRKGFYGRIKQGLYPLPCPLGYLDCGKGKAKEIDPIQGPLVRKAFELYATSKYSLDVLVGEMHNLGLRNKRGGKVTRTGISLLLNNPFYIGLIRLKRTGETFSGVHAHLVTKSLFERVQQVLRGKTNQKVQIHDFLFRRMLTCKLCSYTLTGERQKGHVYYRCQTKGCPTACVREENVEETTLRALEKLELNGKERDYLLTRVQKLKGEWERHVGELTAGLELRLRQINDRLSRLTDAFIDQLIDKSLFEARKANLLLEQKDAEEKLLEMQEKSPSLEDRLNEFLELAGSALIKYKMGLPEEKRDLLKIVTSNRRVEGKNVELMLAQPFLEVAKRSENSYSPPYRDTPRTLDRLLDDLIQWFKIHPKVSIEEEKMAA